MPRRRNPLRVSRIDATVECQPDKVTDADGRCLEPGSVVLVFVPHQRSAYVTDPIGRKEEHNILAIRRKPNDRPAVSQRRDCFSVLSEHISRCLPMPEGRPWCFVVSPFDRSNEVTEDQIRRAINDVWGVEVGAKGEFGDYSVSWRDGPVLWVHPLCDRLERTASGRLQCGLFADSDSPMIPKGTELLPMSGVLGNCSKDKFVQRYEVQTDDEDVAANLLGMPAGFANFAWQITPECNLEYSQERACLVAWKDVQPGQELSWYYGKAPRVKELKVPKKTLAEQKKLLEGHIARNWEPVRKRKRYT